MDNLKDKLEDAILERFKLDCFIKTLSKRIAQEYCDLVKKKYQAIRIKRGKLEYELHGVKPGDDYRSDNDLGKVEVKIKLTYSTVSKVSKSQYRQILKAKNSYRTNGYYDWIDERKYGVLLIQENYSIPIETVTSGLVSLQIDGKL